MDGHVPTSTPGITNAFLYDLQFHNILVSNWSAFLDTAGSILDRVRDINLDFNLHSVFVIVVLWLGYCTGVKIRDVQSWAHLAVVSRICAFGEVI